MSISINQVRKSTSLYWDGSIAEDLIIEIRDKVEKYQDNLIKEVIRDFQDYNDTRRFHGLSLLKRLADTKIYKPMDDSEIGRLGVTNRHTNLSKQTRKSL